ncbi:MAG TPA: ABC transporter permease [Acidimicrobiales bacterium]|nr:ABC transporter permease [Acidimicrobiales bacterium]
MSHDEASLEAVMELDARPDSRRTWLASVWAHRDVLLMLSRADFHVRYKRATFGVLWAVAVPVVQSVVLAVVFSHIIRVDDARAFAAYVLAGVLAWSYFALSVTAASTAIVDGSNLTDKVWFPRALLPIVPCLANLAGLCVSIAVLAVALPFLHGEFGPRLLLLVPAVALLLAFTLALGLALSALHVYFRDVKFLVQAGLLVWFYVTPIAYAKSMLGGLSRIVDFNPVTGIVALFQTAAVGAPPHWQRALLVSVVTTVVLGGVALEAQRRHDRLFVDLL